MVRAANSPSILKSLLLKKHNVLLAGLPRAGKSSVAKVVYGRYSPHQTMYLPDTFRAEIYDCSNTRALDYDLVDLPERFVTGPDVDDEIFERAGCFAFVFDSNREPFDAELTFFVDAATHALSVQPKLPIVILLHKIETEAAPEKTSDSKEPPNFRDLYDLRTKLLGQLEALGFVDGVRIFFTSIYDQSVLEVFGRISQLLEPALTSSLQQLLDGLTKRCRLERAFLLDTKSRTHIAADTSSTGIAEYDVVVDMIETTMEISDIYSDKSTREDCKSCIVQLTAGQVIYMREVDRNLALVCAVREEHFERQYLLDANIGVLQKALRRIFDKREEQRGAPRKTSDVAQRMTSDEYRRKTSDQRSTT